MNHHGKGGTYLNGGGWSAITASQRTWAGGRQCTSFIPLEKRAALPQLSSLMLGLGQCALHHHCSANSPLQRLSKIKSLGTGRSTHGIGSRQTRERQTLSRWVLWNPSNQPSTALDPASSCSLTHHVWNLTACHLLRRLNQAHLWNSYHWRWRIKSRICTSSQEWQN